MACDMLIMKLPMANAPRLPEHPTLRANRHVFVTLGLGMFWSALRGSPGKA